MLNNTKNIIQQSLKKLPFQTPKVYYNFAQRYNKNSNVSQEEQYEQTQNKRYEAPSGPTADQLINQDKSLNAFMSKIYKTTGLSIGGYLGGSYLLAHTPLALMNPFIPILSGLAFSLGGIYFVNKIPPTITNVKTKNGEIVEKWESPQNRKFAFASIVTGAAITSTPFMSYLALVSPGTIPVAAASALMVMGGSSIYAMNKPVGSFKQWESTLSGGLFGLIGMNILSLITTMAIGPNAFSMACFKIDLYAGLALFSAF